MKGRDYLEKFGAPPPLVRIPEGLTPTEQRELIARETGRITQEGSFSDLKNKIEGILKPIGITLDLPDGFRDLSNADKIKMLEYAKSFIKEIEKENKIEALASILKSKFGSKFIVQRSLAYYERHLKPMIDEWNSSENKTSTGSFVAITDGIDPSTPSGRRLSGALGMGGGNNTEENGSILDKMDEINRLKQSLGSKGFTFEHSDDNRGIRRDSQRTKTVIIGKDTDLDTQILFLENLNSDSNYIGEDIGEILGSNKTEGGEILDQEPIYPKDESMEELLGVKEPEKDQAPLYGGDNAIAGLSQQSEPTTPQEAEVEPTVSSQEPVEQHLSDKNKEEIIDVPEEPVKLNQLDNVEEVADNTEQTVQNPEKERILQELSSIRSELAEMDALTHNYSGKTGKSFFALKDEYNSKKGELLKQIGAEIREGDVYGPLTPEQEKLVKSKFDDELYKVLKSENDSYNASVKAVRGENILDKAKESFRDLLGTKGMKWYVGLSRTKRFAINTAMFSVIAAGVAFLAPTGTAATAVSAGAYRMARGVGAFAGSGIGMFSSNKILKPEQLNEWKIQEEQKIKDSEGSIEEKSRRIEELEKEFDRRLRNLNLKKIGITALAGGIGGAISGGILDYAYGGSGGAGGNTVESLKKGANASEHLGGAKTVEVPEPTKPEVPEVVVKKVTNLDDVVSKPNLEGALGLFSYPGAVVQTPLQGKGDSLWSLTKYVLENNERFSSLPYPGQKDNIISYFVNKIQDDPSLINSIKDPDYGVKLEVNKPVDFSKVFDDKSEFDKVLNRAEKLSPDLVRQIEDKTRVFENLYKANPGRVLTQDEIFNRSTQLGIDNIEKPKFGVEEVETPEPLGKLGRYLTESEKAEFMGPALDRVEKIEGNLSELKKLGIEDSRIVSIEKQLLEFKERVKYLRDNYTGPDGKVDAVKDVLGTSEKIEELEKQIQNLVREEIEKHRGLTPSPKAPDLGAMLTEDQNVYATNKPETPVDSPDPETLRREIGAAKNRLGELENSSNVTQMPLNRGVIDPDQLRTMRGDTNSLIRNINNGGEVSSLDTAVERAFYDDVQRAYGSKGFLGLRKVIGVNTKDWGLMRGLSANEVVKYLTDNSAETKLPPNIVSELTKSAKHQAFGKQIIGLIGMTEGKVKPYENENMADFTKRLGRFVMEKHSQGISNIKSPMKMVA